MASPAAPSSTSLQPGSMGTSTGTSSTSTSTSTSRRPSPLRISSNSSSSNSISSRSTSKTRPRGAGSGSRSPSATLVYPDASDVLILQPKELPTLSSASTSPIHRRHARFGSNDSGSGSASSSSHNGGGSGDGGRVGGQDRNGVGGNGHGHGSRLDGLADFSLEAELASAISEDDGGSFFSVINNSNHIASQSRSPSVTTVTPSWPSAEKEINGNKHAANSSTDDAASASASSASTATSVTDGADHASLPSTSSTDFTLDSPLTALSQRHQQQVQALTQQTSNKATPPPSLFVQSADDDNEPTFSPSPFPSPPRTIPSLPPRLDISDFGIYSAAPSPAPSPVSTPPSSHRPLPRLGASGSMLNIPDHLPPLNLPQTPLSLPAVLPEITLTSPSALADLAPLSLLSSAPSTLLLPPQPAPSFGRRHTDPGTTLLGATGSSVGAGGASEGRQGGGLLPAPAQFGAVQEVAAAESGTRTLPSVPSFLGLNGAEEAAELERRLNLLAKNSHGEEEEEKDSGTAAGKDGDEELEKRLRKMQGCGLARRRRLNALLLGLLG
ncbi:hypothetical protein OC834_002031 [Tilletia horrida]|nr:hypothetical protein OC834_002031 [Tilletia horrida]